MKSAKQVKEAPLMRREISAVLCPAGLMACGPSTVDAPDALRTPTQPSRVLGCTDEGPTGFGCPVAFESQEIEDDMATPDGAATGDEPLWSGQISPDDIPGGAYSCPSFVPLARNMVYIPQYNEDVIWLVTGLEKVSDDGFSVQGYPMASYAVAPVDMYSIVPLGKYIMRGGVMKGRCKVKTVRTGLGTTRVIHGPIFWYDYTGTVKLAADGSGGSESRGWGWFEYGNGTKTGAGSGTDGKSYSSVLDDYMAGRGCTRGWEIWIDQALRCDVEGHEH